MSRLFLLLALAQIALSPQTAAATDAPKLEYMRALEKRIPSAHRAGWTAHLARETICPEVPVKP